MAAVAERLVLRRATAAQSDPRVFPYQPTVRVDDADGASDEERTIRTWLDRGFLRRLFLPTAIETADTPEKKQILTAIMSASEIGTSFFTTPKTPVDRVEALRRAFDATMKDAAFTGDLNRMGMSMGPMTGEDLQKLVTEVSAITPELLEKVRKAYPEEGK